MRACFCSYVGPGCVVDEAQRRPCRREPAIGVVDAQVQPELARAK